MLNVCRERRRNASGPVGLLAVALSFLTFPPPALAGGSCITDRGDLAVAVQPLEYKVITDCYDGADMWDAPEEPRNLATMYMALGCLRTILEFIRYSGIVLDQDEKKYEELMWVIDQIEQEGNSHWGLNWRGAGTSVAMAT